MNTEDIEKLIDEIYEHEDNGDLAEFARDRLTRELSKIIEHIENLNAINKRLKIVIRELEAQIPTNNA